MASDSAEQVWDALKEIDSRYSHLIHLFNFSTTGPPVRLPAYSSLDLPRLGAFPPTAVFVRRLYLRLFLFRKQLPLSDCPKLVEA